MGGGGATKPYGGGGQETFYLYKKGGGAETSLSHAEAGGWGGGAHKVFVVLTRELEVLAILEDGGVQIHPLKRHGGMCEKFNPVLGGGGVQKDSDPRFSHFVISPLLITGPLRPGHI